MDMLLFKNFNKTTVTEESFDIPFDGLDVAMFESFRDFDVYRGAMPQALCTCYEAYGLGQMDQEKVEVTLEGLLADGFSKLKGFFKKIYDKIVGWLKGAYKFFETMIISNKKFVEKYEKELSTKEASKFKYSGYKWNDGELSKWRGKVSGTQKSAKEAFGTAVSAINADGAKSADEGYKISDKKKAVDQALGVRGVGDFKEKMTKAVRGGSSKSEITGFSAVSRDAMIKEITDEKSTLSEIKEAANSVQEAANSYGDEVDKLREAFDKANKGHAGKANYMSYVNHAADVAKYQLSYETAALEATRSLVHEKVSEFSGALRSFARYTPSKESFGLDNGGEPTLESTSILDQFMAEM